MYDDMYAAYIYISFCESMCCFKCSCQNKGDPQIDDANRCFHDGVFPELNKQLISHHALRHTLKFWANPVA